MNANNEDQTDVGLDDVVVDEDDEGDEDDTTDVVMPAELMSGLTITMLSWASSVGVSGTQSLSKSGDETLFSSSSDASGPSTCGAESTNESITSGKESAMS